MSADNTSVGDLVAAFLHQCQVATAFGVISIHNMPVLDAFARRQQIRFIPSRGEAGAVNMADANARVSGTLGVAVTSTGTGAGNAAGALVEAMTASTPLLHLTGQIETDYLDLNKGYIHEARDQLAMLQAVGKAAFRVRTPESALGILKESVRIALTPPCGPVSIEIPIDIQKAQLKDHWPNDLTPLPISQTVIDNAAITRVAERLANCRRPMLWLGGGARKAGSAVKKLADLGFGIVTSVQGRGILAEDDSRSLGAFNAQPAIEAFYQSCDAMLVVGSRLRSNETLKYTLQLPQPLIQIDIDPQAAHRNYPVDDFICGDSAEVLTALAESLDGRLNTDTNFFTDLTVTKTTAAAQLRDDIAPYTKLVDALQTYAGRNFNWVRDITLSNSTWGNRLLPIFSPRSGVHALGGGIGQAVPMGIGAALATPNQKTIVLTGDGGLQLCLGELSTAVQERANIALIVMNDNGYGVIRNIQDVHYGGRRQYVDLLTPDFSQIAASIGLPYRCLQDIHQTQTLVEQTLAEPGPALLEVDMVSIGPMAKSFAGPPARNSR